MCRHIAPGHTLAHTATIIGMKPINTQAVLTIVSYISIFCSKMKGSAHDGSQRPEWNDLLGAAIVQSLGRPIKDSGRAREQMPAGPKDRLVAVTHTPGTRLGGSCARSFGRIEPPIWFHGVSGVAAWRRIGMALASTFTHALDIRVRLGRTSPVSPTRSRAWLLTWTRLHPYALGTYRHRH